MGDNILKARLRKIKRERKSCTLCQCVRYKVHYVGLGDCGVCALTCMLVNMCVYMCTV